MTAVLSDLGDLGRLEGNWGEALEYHVASLEIRGRLGDAPGIAESLEAFAHIADARKEPAASARFLGAAEVLCSSTSAALPRSHRRELERLGARVEETLGSERFASETARGSALSRDEAIEEVLRFVGHEGATPGAFRIGSEAPVPTTDCSARRISS